MSRAGSPPPSSGKTRSRRNARSKIGAQPSTFAEELETLALFYVVPIAAWLTLLPIVRRIWWTNRLEDSRAHPGVQGAGSAHQAAASASQSEVARVRRTER